MLQDVHKLALYAIVYHLWGERNTGIFRNQALDPGAIILGLRKT